MKGLLGVEMLSLKRKRNESGLRRRIEEKHFFSLDTEEKPFVHGVNEQEKEEEDAYGENSGEETIDKEAETIPLRSYITSSSREDKGMLRKNYTTWLILVMMWILPLMRRP